MPDDYILEPLAISADEIDKGALFICVVSSKRECLPRSYTERLRSTSSISEACYIFFAAFGNRQTETPEVIFPLIFYLMAVVVYGQHSCTRAIS